MKQLTQVKCYFSESISRIKRGFVLVWAGIKSIFFIVVGMGQWFVSVLKTVMITQGYFSYC